MTNLDFDALLNADSIPVLRGTKHIATQEAKMLRFRQRLSKNWHADSQASIENNDPSRGVYHSL
jgi:hypothetical protein